jgi:cytochrome c peroxidase
MAEGAIGGRAFLRILPIAIAGALLVAASDAFELPVPAGVLPPEVPAENPPTAAKVSLGQKLYFDTRLSTDGRSPASPATTRATPSRTGAASPRRRASAARSGRATRRRC